MRFETINETDNKYKDILDTILDLDDFYFKMLIHGLRFDGDSGLPFYNSNGDISIPVYKFFDYLSKAMENYDDNSIERDRIEKVVNSRGEKEFCSIITEKGEGIYEHEFQMVKKVFEILEVDELFEQFKQFNPQNADNMKFFRLSRDNEISSQNIQNYLRIMVCIFGSVDGDGRLVNTSPTLNDYYIPQIDKYKSRFLEIYKMYQPQAEAEAKKLKHKFDIRKVPKKSDSPILSIVPEEPEWELNEEIRAAVLDGISDTMSPETKALFIYDKMCKIFSYDEGYLYRDQDEGIKINYTPYFHKEYLESLTLNSRFTCFDFARVYKKIVDGLGEPITVAMLAGGVNQGHFTIGIATERCQATLDAMSPTGENGERANDLLRAKSNMELDGICYNSGDKEVLAEAEQEAWNSAIKTTEPTTVDLINKLMEIDKNDKNEEMPINAIEFIQDLIAKMKQLKIYGNEFTNVFNNVLHRTKTFMSKQLRCSYVGEVFKEDDDKIYKRRIWIINNQPSDTGELSMYLIDTEKLNMYSVTEADMRSRLKNGELVYEKKEYQMKGFEI